MSSAGHGPNIGHGYVKYVVIDKEGNELPPVVFPAMISRAGRSVAGAIARVDTVSAGGAQWWTGEDALLAPSPLTILAQERLIDTAFVPALLRSALQRLGNLNGVVETHPWAFTSQLDPDDLPVFSLTSQEAGAVTERPRRAGDTVAGFGFESATVRLAELLLNIGLLDNPLTEYVLEGEGEHRGVGDRSAEVRFLLPGSGEWENVL